MICRLYWVMASGGILYRCAATPEKKSGSAGADVLGAAIETLADGLGGALLRKWLCLLVEGAGSSSASSSLDTVGWIQTTLCQSEREKNEYEQIEKSKFAIPSCSRYVARVIYKLRLNAWNTKYSQNVTRVCKNILSVKHILLECSITTELFQKNGYDFNACYNIWDILCNTDIINSIVKLIVHRPVGKLVEYFVCLCVCVCV